MSTPEVIDLTGDFDANVASSQAKPQYSRHSSNVSSTRNHSSAHLGHGHNSAPASTSHLRHTSYQPGSPFGVFASGHPSPPHTRHNVVNGGHSVHSPPSSVRSVHSLDRQSSFETEPSSAPLRYTLPSPPASAPAASMVSGFPPFSRLPPPPTAPVMNIASHVLHSPFIPPTDSRAPRHSASGNTLTKEIIFATLHEEAEKIRQVTMMVAQRNQQMRSISEHYERSGLLLVKQEDTQRGNVTGGGSRNTNAEETIARLQDELDRSRNLNQGLVQRNEELRDVQRETDELRRAYRDLLQKNETLQRQQKIDNPVRMLKHLQVTSPDGNKRGSDAHAMEAGSPEGGTINRELDFALSLLNLRREELNDMMGTGTPLQGAAGSKNIENGCSVSHHIRRIIAEHTNLQLLIRRLTKTRSDYASERIGKSNMLDLCDELEKQLSQMAQRMLEGLPNGYEGIMGALRSEWHENENGVDPNGPLSGSDDSPISPASRGPLSPSSTSSQSPDTRIGLKRRRIGDVDVESKR
ncbi:hypothetical protein L218DRAFT_685296 [Marasmius fiardii PR-910]|nr:hypothetical protein L218DRAFT_685296 [Marasmius fiardii PR-910]